MKRRVQLFGERSGVRDALCRLGWEALPEGSRERPDAAVALTEAAVLPAAERRAALGLPGLCPATALRCRDKVLMKEAVRAAGITCTDWSVLEAGSDPAVVARRLGLPLFVKGRLSSGGRGQEIARSVDEIRPGPGRIAERTIRGVEMSVESFVADARPVFLNCTEYLRVGCANVMPAALDPATRESVEDLNRRALAALGIDRGMTHVELFLTEKGPVFGEIAVRPPGGRIMRLLRRVYGFDPWEALLRIEVGEAPAFPGRPRGAAGVWMLHPGPGVLRAIEGIEEARAVPCVTRVVCRRKVGDRIGVRHGTGQDIGFLEARGADRDEVARALLGAHARLRLLLDPA